MNHEIHESCPPPFTRLPLCKRGQGTRKLVMLSEAKHLAFFRAVRDFSG